VIYITFDGIRWQDIFFDHTRMPIFWKKYAKKGDFFGAPHSNTIMEVASIPISLPSYQSQMSGTVQACDDNDCGRISVETLLEKLVHRLKLHKKDVAIFASWAPIAFATEHHIGTTYTNAGNTPAIDPDTLLPDAVMAKLNQKQLAHHPKNIDEKTDRYDQYTYAQAIYYYSKFQPRFIWMSFVDADKAAHKGDLVTYNKMLLFYDSVLDSVFTALKALMLDQETLVIITTDHGRGNGIYWTEHGGNYPESKQTWAFVLNGSLLPNSADSNGIHYSTLSIRKTVEATL
jgi:hypothetical protein